MHDAVTAVENARAKALLGHSLITDASVNPETGEIEPIVTDKGGPFRSFAFGALIAARPWLRRA